MASDENLRFKALALLLAVVGFGLGTVHAESPRLADFEKQVKPIIAKHCVRCHGPKSQEGDLRIDQLDPNLLEGKDADYWHEVLNQLNEGEMPPKEEAQLTTQELDAITTWLETELKKAAARRSATGGRHLMRRMSRYEYQYTLQDLLGISLDYSEGIPDDLSGEDGLQTNASRLGMSMIQMQSYLDVAEQALREAIPMARPKCSGVWQPNSRSQRSVASAPPSRQRKSRSSTSRPARAHAK